MVYFYFCFLILCSLDFKIQNLSMNNKIWISLFYRLFRILIYQYIVFVSLLMICILLFDFRGENWLTTNTDQDIEECSNMPKCAGRRLDPRDLRLENRPLLLKDLLLRLRLITKPWLLQYMLLYSMLNLMLSCLIISSYLSLLPLYAHHVARHVREGGVT